MGAPQGGGIKEGGAKCAVGGVGGKGANLLGVGSRRVWARGGRWSDGEGVCMTYGGEKMVGLGLEELAVFLEEKGKVVR